MLFISNKTGKQYNSLTELIKNELDLNLTMEDCQKSIHTDIDPDEQKTHLEHLINDAHAKVRQAHLDREIVKDTVKEILALTEEQYEKVKNECIQNLANIVESTNKRVTKMLDDADSAVIAAQQKENELLTAYDVLESKKASEVKR